MGKLIYKTLGFAAIVLLGFTFYEASLQGHQSDMAGTLTAGRGIAQLALNTAGPAADRTISKFTANLQSYLNSGEFFLQRNGTKARLQFDSMANSLPSSLGDWLPRNGSNWLQTTAQKASQVAGNNPDALAKKIPIVHGALDATKARITAVGQSISGGASGF
jgi:hypothetical protein